MPRQQIVDSQVKTHAQVGVAFQSSCDVVVVVQHNESDEIGGNV